MGNPDKEISYLATSNFRKSNVTFGIKQKDRLLHTYVIGKTGTGKSNLLVTICLQDIFAGRGLAVMDVHGDLLKTLIRNIPPERRSDLVYLDLTNPKLHFRYNPLKKVSPEKRSLVAAGMLETFQKLWKGAWGVKLEHILRYSILTLLDQPEAYMTDIPRILNDPGYRGQCLGHVGSKVLQDFWLLEFPKFSKNDFMPVLNKLGAFLVHPVSKRFLVDNRQDISIRACMDQKKIVLVNLSKGIIGDDVARLIGSLLLNAIAFSAFSRSGLIEGERQPFHVILDEFHNYANPTLATMLSELRKYKVSLTMAHQYMQQLGPDIRNAVLGNVGTIISFRLGLADARLLEHEFYPVFSAPDFINLENHEIYLKLMIDGKPSRAFSANTFHFQQINMLAR